MSFEEPVCPVTGSYHKYFVYSTKTDFEPVTDPEICDLSDTQLYKRVEYAILNCNCTSVIRKQVTKQ